jgi:outer membrane protein TolC
MLKPGDRGRKGPTTLKRRLVRSLLLIGLCGSGYARAEAQLTIEDAVKMALSTNERSLKTPLRIEAAEGQLERARTAFLPSLVASGAGTVSGTQDRNGRILAGTGAVTLNVPLFNLPAYPLYAQARHQLESERWGATEDRRTLGFDTAHAFLVAASSERVLEAAQKRRDRAQANQQDTEARAQAELTSTNDVTRAIIETASADGQVAQMRGGLERAYLQLGFLVGKQVAGPLVVPERTSQAAERGAFRMDEVLRLAESRRPDLRSSEERTEALRESAREPLFRLAPTLGASAQLRATVDPIAPAAPYDESAQLTLTWTLYDAGARYADRKTRLAQAESQALDERQLRRSIAVDINLALASLRAAREGYISAEAAAVAAKRSDEETEILYKQGLARAIELTNATAARYDAEVSVASARLAMEQAYLGLRQALGLAALGDDLAGNMAAPTKAP